MKKIIMFCALTIFMFVSAQNYKVGVDLDVRTKAESIGEGVPFTLNDTDTFKVTFSAAVDNVSASVTIKPNNAGGAFDSASLTVADLFDGILTLKFFDIGYGKGKDNAILQDVGAHGVNITVKPIDILSIYLAYGIRNTEFKGVYKNPVSRGVAAFKANTANPLVKIADAATTDANAAATAVVNAGAGATDAQHKTAFDTKAYAAAANAAVDVAANKAVTDRFAKSGTKLALDGNFKSDIHAVSVGLDLSMDVIDVGAYYGMMIFDNSPSFLKVGTDGNVASLLPVNDKSQGIALMSAGVSVDALKYFGAGLLKVDLGLTFGGAYNANYFRGSSFYIDGDKAKVKNDLNLVAILHGGVSNIADVGVGIDYYFHYALDTATKQQALGDLDDDYFANNIKLKVTPSYTISQFKISLPIQFAVLGTEQAFDAGLLDETGTKKGTKKALVNPMSLSLEPTLTWTPSPGFSVDLYLDYDIADLSGVVKSKGAKTSDAYKKWNTDLDIGMRMKAAFDISGTIAAN